MSRHRGAIIEAEAGDLEEEDSELRAHSVRSYGITSQRRNLFGFWLLGLCNNFAYVIMLSAAKDILDPKTPDDLTGNSTECRDIIDSRNCHALSTGSVLLADIIPALIIKITAPLYILRIPFGIRHIVTVSLQACSFLLVAFSSTIPMALFGVVLASLGSGLGEVSYLALTSYFDTRVIGFWSSGTGGAGIFGALTYAVLTDSKILGFSPSQTLMYMLVVPVVFAFTYWTILDIPNKVHRVQLAKVNTYLVREEAVHERPNDTEPLIGEDTLQEGPTEKKTLMRSLLKYMVPLVCVYFGEYFINQGISELLEFDCSHGFGLSSSSQYRWYQVLYQLGVFISRSSAEYLTIPTRILPVLAVLQMLNAGMFLLDARMPFVPHIGIIFIVIVYEGLLGGASYVNTFRAIHDEIKHEDREFSMGFVSISDTLGIVLSGFLAIPIHNFICSTPLIPA